MMAKYGRNLYSGDMCMFVIFLRRRWPICYQVEIYTQVFSIENGSMVNIVPITDYAPSNLCHVARVLLNSY